MDITATEKNNTPLLSIITINYNNAAGLKKTIESVVAQNFDDYEHIIVDGGSKDGSVDVIKKYEKYISWWCSEKDNGIYNAMNKGIRHANGKYCLFLNSGDWLCDETALNKVKLSHPNEDIIYFNALFVTKETSFVIKYPEEITGLFFFSGSTLSHQNTLIKTSIQQLLPYSDNYRISSDVEFFMNALIKKNCTSRHVHDVIVCFDCENGISNDPKTKNERDFEWERLKNQFFPPRIQQDLKLLQEFNNFKKRFKGIPYKLYRLFIKIRGF